MKKEIKGLKSKVVECESTVFNGIARPPVHPVDLLLTDATPCKTNTEKRASIKIKKPKREWSMYGVIWPDGTLVHVVHSKGEALAKYNKAFKELGVKITKVKVSEV